MVVRQSLRERTKGTQAAWLATAGAGLGALADVVLVAAIINDAMANWTVSKPFWVFDSAVSAYC